jgi:hypothetical protein
MGDGSAIKIPSGRIFLRQYRKWRNALYFFFRAWTVGQIGAAFLALGDGVRAL